jgi:MFS family permease
MEATTPAVRGAPAAGTRARGAARANLAGSCGQVLATFGAPGSVLLTLFLQDGLHAAKWHIGLVMTMTFLGPTFEPLGAFLAERLGRRRPLFLAAFLCNRIPFLALAVIPLLGPADACRHLGIALVLAVVAVTRPPAHLGTPAWWSWMADLVPERRRGRFFGWRTQTASAVAALSFVAGMTLLQACGGMGNRLLVSGLFAVGAVFGIADILLYLRVPEPGVKEKGIRNKEKREGPVASGLGPCAGPISYFLFPFTLFRDFAAPFRQPGYRRLILGMGLWSFSANLVLPFLPIYQSGEVLAGRRLGLGLSWTFLAVLNVSSSVGALLTSRWWARWGDRLGPRRLLLLGSGYLFVNLAYLLVAPGHALGLLVPGTLIGGALSAAWTVSANQLLLGVAPRAKRSFYVSAYNFTNGWLMAGGPLLGGLLADRLPVVAWRLPTGLPCCYFHLLLGLAVTGGLAALTVLGGVPAPAPAVRTTRAEMTRVLWYRVRLFGNPRPERSGDSGDVDNPKEYATI